MYSVPVAGYAPSQASITIDTNISSSNLSSINASITNATINNLTTTIFNPVSITCDSLDVQNLTVDNSIVLLNVETLNVSTKNVCQLNVLNASMTNISVQNISCTSFTSPDVQPLLIAGDNVSILNNIINVTNDALLPSNANFSSINTSSLSVNNNVVIGGTTYITDLIVSDVINCSTIQANNLSTAEMQFGNSLAYVAVAKILEVNTTDTISSGNTLPVTSGAVYNAINTQTTTISTMWSYMLSESEFVLVNSTINGGVEDTICYLDITPQYEGSKIHVEFCFSYSVTGFGTDSIVTEIRVGKNNNTTQTIIQELFQEWTGSGGGGTRSGASNTISASYQNTDTLGKYHRIQLRVDNNSDDTWGLDNISFVSIKVIEFIETAGYSNPNILIGSGNISCGNISCNTITALNHTIDNLITTENVNVGGSMVTVGFPESGVIVSSSMVRLAGGAVVQNYADMAWDGTTFNISTRQSTKNFKVSFGQVAYLEVDSTNVSVQSLKVNQGLEVLGSLTYNDLILNDSLLLNGTLLADGGSFRNDVIFERDVDIEQTLNVSNINVSGNIVVAGTLTGSNISTVALIPGTNITITNNIISAFVQSDADIVISSLHVDNNANIYGVLNVSETSNFGQSLNVDNQLFVGKAGEINGNLVIYSTNIGDNFQIQNGVTETSLLGTGNISKFNFSLGGNQTLTIKPTEVNITGDLIVSGAITGALDFENLSVTNLSVGTMTVDSIEGDLNVGNMFASSLTTTGHVETGKWLIGASDSTTASLYNKDITSVTTHYALRQTDGGGTSLNGTAVYFKNNGTDVGEWTSTGLSIGKTTPTTTLDVLGTSLFTGTLNVEGTLNVSGELKPNYIETNDFNLKEGTGQYTNIYRSANQTVFVGNNNTAGSDFVFYPLTSSDQPALQIKRDLTTVIQDLQVVALIEAANICVDNNISCTGSMTIANDLEVEGNMNVSELNTSHIETSDFNLNEGTGQYTNIYRSANQTLFVGNNNTAGSDFVFYPLTSSDQPALQIKRDLTTVIQDLQVVALIEAANICVDNNISCTGSMTIDNDLTVVQNVNICGTLTADNIVGVDLLNICSTNISTTNLSATQTTSQNINCSTLTIDDTAGSIGLDVTGVGYFRTGLFVYNPAYLEGTDNYFGEPAGTDTRSRINFWSQKAPAEVGLRFGCDSDDIVRLNLPRFGQYTHYNINISNTSTMDMDNTSTKFHQNVNISGTLATQNVSAAGHIESAKWFIGASDSTTASLYNKAVTPITTHYALRQTDGGATSINGTGVYFKNLGVDVGEWTATGLGVGKTTPSKKLDVLGDSLFTGNVNISGTLAADQIVGIDLLNICSTNISTTNLSATQTTSQNINCSTLTIDDTAGSIGLDVTGVGYFRTGLFVYNPAYLEGTDNYFGEPAGTDTRSRINFWSQKAPTEVGLRFGCDSDDIVRLNLPRFGQYTHYNINISNTSTMDMDNTSTKFHHNVNISGTLSADNIAGLQLTNICSTNISTSNLSTNKITFLTSYGLYQDFTGATNVSLAQVKGDILSALGATFSATTLNSSTLNSSTIKARNIFIQDLGASLNFSATGVLNNNETGCVTNLKTCNISTLNSSFLDVLNASITNDLDVDGVIDCFNLLSDTGIITTLDSTTINASTLNASTINGDNLSTASMLFNSDFQFSLNTLSLAPSETSAAIQSATLSTLATQVDSLFGNFSTFNSDFGTIGGVLNMQFANTSQINASNLIGINVSANNISCINLSSTEISTASATMGSDTLTMASNKYLESVSNYAFYWSNIQVNMTGTFHLVEFQANTLESALVTQTSNTRYTINRAGYYRISSSLYPENLAINDRVCYRGLFLKNGVENSIWSSDSYCYTRDDNFGEFGTCPLEGVLDLVVNDYIEVEMTARIGSSGSFGSNMTGSRIRVRSNLTFQYLG